MMQMLAQHNPLLARLREQMSAGSHTDVAAVLAAQQGAAQQAQALAPTANPSAANRAVAAAPAAAGTAQVEGGAAPAPQPHPSLDLQQLVAGVLQRGAAAQAQVNAAAAHQQQQQQLLQAEAEAFPSGSELLARLLQRAAAHPSAKQQ